MVYRRMRLNEVECNRVGGKVFRILGSWAERRKVLIVIVRFLDGRQNKLFMLKGVGWRRKREMHQFPARNKLWQGKGIQLTRTFFISQSFCQWPQDLLLTGACLTALLLLPKTWFLLRAPSGFSEFPIIALDRQWQPCFFTQQQELQSSSFYASCSMRHKADVSSAFTGHLFYLCCHVKLKVTASPAQLLSICYSPAAHLRPICGTQ